MNVSAAFVQAKLAECLSRVNPSIPLPQAHCSLKSVGLDSMEIVNFFLEVELCFEIELPQEIIDDQELYEFEQLINYLTQFGQTQGQIDL